MSSVSNGSGSTAEASDDISRKWSAFAAGLRVPPPESAAGQALLRAVAASQPIMDMEPFLREVAALRSQLDAVRCTVAEGGGAGERGAAIERLRREGAAKDALIAALKAQVRGLQERLAVEGPIPAGCVASSSTHKAVVAEREGLKAQLAATQAAAEAAAAAAQAAADRAASAAAAQLASAKAQGECVCQHDRALLQLSRAWPPNCAAPLSVLQPLPVILPLPAALFLRCVLAVSRAAASAVAAAEALASDRARMLTALQALTGIAIRYVPGSAGAGAGSSGGGAGAAATSQLPFAGVLGVYACSTSAPATGQGELLLNRRCRATSAVCAFVCPALFRAHSALAPSPFPLPCPALSRPFVPPRRSTALPP